MKSIRCAFALLAAIFLAAALAACQSSGADAGEQTVSGEATYIENKGSDTMVNLAMVWAERYQQNNPAVRISVTGGGSGTGLASLMNGTVDVANASRQIKSEEIEQAHEKGFDPIEFAVARDAIAVIVHPQNPINEMTIEEISLIFRGSYTNWSELDGEDRPIVRVSRETNSGTHVYFLEAVIRQGSKEDKTIFAADTLLLPSSEGIISEVSDNPNAIGYDGLGYVTEHVKIIAISRGEGLPYVLPNVGTVGDGSYAISRELYMYSRGQPQGLTADYVEWVFSAEAQQIVGELGFVPVIAE